jgi:hypothetical protein
LDCGLCRLLRRLCLLVWWGRLLEGFFLLLPSTFYFFGERLRTAVEQMRP